MLGAKASGSVVIGPPGPISCEDRRETIVVERELVIHAGEVESERPGIRSRASPAVRLALLPPLRHPRPGLAGQLVTQLLVQGFHRRDRVALQLCEPHIEKPPGVPFLAKLDQPAE